MRPVNEDGPLIAAGMASGIFSLCPASSVNSSRRPSPQEMLENPHPETIRLACGPFHFNATAPTVATERLIGSRALPLAGRLSRGAHPR